MGDERRILEQAIRRAISGADAHAETKAVFSGLDWKLVGTKIDGAPYSIYQLLNHMFYWQDWVLKWLDGAEPPIPKHASGGWPGEIGPGNRKNWEVALRRFHSGLEKLARSPRHLDLLAKGREKTPFEMLLTIASHNSYHAGQVALLRRALGAWPPPSGGITW